MLSGKELKEYRELRGLSLRDVSDYCDVSFQLIGYVENGQKDVTDHNHKQIVDGINRAYFAKINGTFERKPTLLSDKNVEKQQEEEKVETSKITTPKKPITKIAKTKK